MTADNPFNDLIAWGRAIDRDSPAKRWWHAPANHPAIYRALKIDPQDPTARYACDPFRLARRGNSHVILAPYPAPKMGDWDWLGVEAVLVWDPVANLAEVMGDDTPQLVGSFDESPGRTAEDGTLYADAFAFFRAWAEERARYVVTCRHLTGHWQVRPVEKTTPPGVLMIGDAQHVRWQPQRLPQTLHCVGVDPTTVNRAIMRTARLPRAVPAHQLRAAA